MAKQTFTTGQVLTAAQMSSLQQTAMGGGEATAKVASYVLLSSDAGTTVIMNSGSATTITVNTALFAAGDTVNIQNIGAGICTILAGSATVNTAGSLALNQYEGGVLYFRSTSAATFFDYVQTGSVSPLTTKGDLYGFSTLDARIPIGTNNQVLTADSAQALGLKWATPSGALTLSQIATGTLSGTSVTLSSLSSYDYLLLQVYGILCNTSNTAYFVRINNESTSIYTLIGSEISATPVINGISNGTQSGVFYTWNTSALRTSTDNRIGIAFQNCKSAGFTSYQANAEYLNDSSIKIKIDFNGMYAKAEAVSSLVIGNQAGNTFTAGTYVLWGG